MNESVLPSSREIHEWVRKEEQRRQSVETADPAALAAELVGLENRLRIQRAPLGRLLRPGAPEEELQATFSWLGLTLPDELRVLYQWHDGTIVDFDEPEDPDMPGLWIFDRLRSAVLNYLDLVTFFEETGDLGDPDHMLSTWFPISYSDGRALLVECNVPPGQASHIYVYCHDDVTHCAATSLLSVVRLWNRMFDEGYFVYDPYTCEWLDRFSEIPVELRISGLVD